MATPHIELYAIKVTHLKLFIMNKQNTIQYFIVTIFWAAKISEISHSFPTI